jgi:acyl carrier protein
MGLTENEIYEKVREVLVESLGVDAELVTREACLSDDLGADSLDYLDIAFHMEKAFGVPIKLNEMLLGDSPSEEFVRDGRITDAGLAEVRRRMPHLRLDRFEASRDIKDFRQVFTVDALVQFMRLKLNANAASPVPV